MKATVLVRPKEGILDPQGQAVESSLRQLGFPVGEARVGRVVDLELEATDAARRASQVERMCEQLLANPLIESYEIELTRRERAHRGSPSLVVPGVERRPRRRAGRSTALGADPSRLARATRSSPTSTGVVLPGGFSYGDYLRCGAIARFAPAMDAVVAFAEDGGPVLGICNGFQILCEAGLLPGVLRPNASLEFICRDVPRARRARRPEVHGTLRSGQVLSIPMKHGEGCWYADEELFAELDANGPGRPALRRRTRTARSTTSPASCNQERQRLGLMPHPEHAVDPLLGPADGAFILASLVDAAREREVALV